MAHASENTHWYDKDGNPVYTVKAKSGADRNTTLADARKLDLKPGVTTIIGLMASPALDMWKQEQLLMAALTTTRLEDESEAEFISRIKQSAKEQSEKARDLGTAIHAKVQCGFEGMIAYKDDDYYLSSFQELAEKTGITFWNCEQSFATDKYGGKIDLICDDYIIDVKTTSKPLEGLKTWDSHALQLSAYRRQGKQKCGILYVNSESAESKLIMLEEKDLERGYKMFMNLVDLYYNKTGL
jgi:hypothetical protein